jgi:hypothetical protein
MSFPRLAGLGPLSCGDMLIRWKGRANASFGSRDFLMSGAVTSTAPSLGRIPRQGVQMAGKKAHLGRCLNSCTLQ